MMSWMTCMLVTSAHDPARDLMLALITNPSTSSISSNLENIDSISVSYHEARDKRIKYGHHEAVHLYKSLLRNQADLTAASRIAAAEISPQRHDAACPIPLDTKSSIENEKIRDEIKALKHILEKSNFSNQHIQRLCGIPRWSEVIDKGVNNLKKGELLGFAQCPIYLTPVKAGTHSKLPSFLDEDIANNNSSNSIEELALVSLKSLVSLFLLGFAVPRDILARFLIGGNSTIVLMESLGLIYPCEVDDSIMVPYVHIFPLDINLVNEKNDITSKQSQTSIYIVTDCHPNILGQATVGTKQDGAVMYIGPDSLALIQHLPLQSQISSIKQKFFPEFFSIADFCTGSGIQAISALAALQLYRPNARAVCIDINDRALRFVQFNGLLNGVEEKIKPLKGDLLSGDVANMISSSEKTRTSEIEVSKEGFVATLKESAPFNMILANPPFIPVPERDSIEKRYGLFSSGGASGEVVLRTIISISRKLLNVEGGLCGIVSELMNAPTREVENTELFDKIQNWWNQGCKQTISQTAFRGVLFTNEFPISAKTYASRRTDTESDFQCWLKHLEAIKITNVSPGLLFVAGGHSIDKQKTNECMPLDLKVKQVPQTAEGGSIWTPYNALACEYTRKEWEKIMIKSL